MKTSNVTGAICCMVMLAVTSCNPNTSSSSAMETPSASAGTPHDFTFTGTPTQHMLTANSGHSFARLQFGEHYFAGPFG